MFEIKNKMGSAIWNIAEDGTVQRWCELYDSNGYPISFESEEESKQYINTVLIPFLTIVLTELMVVPQGEVYARNLPAILNYAKRFVKNP